MPCGEGIIHRTIVKIITCDSHGLTVPEADLNLHEDLRRKGLDPAEDIGKVEIKTHMPAMIIIDKKGDLTYAADHNHCMLYTSHVPVPCI